MASLQMVKERSAQWLLDHQDQETGGWADQLGRPPSTLNTAEVVIALLDGKAAAPGDARIQRAVRFLLGHRLADGPDRGAWPREISGDDDQHHDIPDMVRTSFAIEALIKAGIAVAKNDVSDGARWLLSIQNADMGWGYRK